MNQKILLAQKSYLKKNIPEISPGDTVLVHQKIKEGNKERLQIFEGVVIALHRRRNLDATFTVRKIAAGRIGVEKTFPLHSPTISKIEKIKSAKVRRAKLYFLRNLKTKKSKFKKEKKEQKEWSELVVEESPKSTTPPSVGGPAQGGKNG